MNKQSTHQLYAYAGHDSTVSNLLIALDVWDEQIPTYNMLALLELHESKKGNFYLKVFNEMNYIFQFMYRYLTEHCSFMYLHYNFFFL